MISFLRYQSLCFFVSALILLLGIGLYVKKGGFSYSIDFVGGTEIRVATDHKVDIGEVRRAVSKAGFLESSVQNIQGDQEFIIKIADFGIAEEAVLDSLNREIPNADFKIKSLEQVGPEAGSEERWNAIWAILLCMIILLAYIAIRYRYDYALGAIFALVHDVLVMLVACLVFDLNFSINILAGILSVLGYSLNDSVVVFHRIRSNMGLAKQMPMSQIVDLSLNQTLSRTLLTSLTTFISVLSLYIWGGDVLRPFALILMVGVVFGTYSSIYIASPVMLYFNSGKDL